MNKAVEAEDTATVPMHWLQYIWQWASCKNKYCSAREPAAFSTNLELAFGTQYRCVSKNGIDRPIPGAEAGCRRKPSLQGCLRTCLWRRWWLALVGPQRQATATPVAAVGAAAAAGGQTAPPACLQARPHARPCRWRHHTRLTSGEVASKPHSSPSVRLDGSRPASGVRRCLLPRWHRDRARGCAHL